MAGTLSPFLSDVFCTSERLSISTLFTVDSDATVIGTRIKYQVGSLWKTKSLMFNAGLIGWLINWLTD